MLGLGSVQNYFCKFGRVDALRPPKKGTLPSAGNWSFCLLPLFFLSSFLVWLLVTDRRKVRIVSPTSTNSVRH